MALELIC